MGFAWVCHMQCVLALRRFACPQGPRDSCEEPRLRRLLAVAGHDDADFPWQAPLPGDAAPHAFATRRRRSMNAAPPPATTSNVETTRVSASMRKLAPENVVIRPLKGKVKASSRERILRSAPNYAGLMSF